MVSTHQVGKTAVIQTPSGNMLESLRLTCAYLPVCFLIIHILSCNSEKKTSGKQTEVRYACVRLLGLIHRQTSRDSAVTAAAESRIFTSCSCLDELRIRKYNVFILQLRIFWSS